MDHSLQLKYQRNYSIIINDCDVSLFYYFDYGERYKQINMEFQHSHRFHEIMIPLSPDAIHFNTSPDVFPVFYGRRHCAAAADYSSSD